MVLMRAPFRYLPANDEYPARFTLALHLNWDSDELTEAITWCRINLGPMGERWSASDWCIHAHDDAATFEFRLRWC